MYKAIIVDDEKWIVEGIKVGVDWNKFGFEVIGEAENGQDALQLIESLRPDIVFTDIKMPILNGLELIKKGKAAFPDILFVVLSGHAEFAYAQKAINYGTFGYCLKPFEIEEIDSMLIRLSQALKARKPTISPSYSDELYEAICSGDQASMEQILEANGMPVNTRSAITPIVIQGKELTQIDQRINHLTFPMNRRRHGYLVYDHQKEAFLQNASNVNKTNEYSIGVGHSLTVISELEASLEAASLAAYGIFSTGKTGVYTAPVQVHSPIDEKLKEISNALNNKDRVQLATSLASTRTLFHNGIFSIKDAYLIFTSVMYLFLRDGVKVTSKLFEGYEQLYTYFGSVDAMIDYLIKNTSDYFSEEISARVTGIAHKKVKEILLYIHNNFNQEISIQSLSDKFYLSPNYLCQLFKKEVGENFVEYISKQRIQYACKLLDETDLSINQIGEKCGFNDYFYFTRIFKRINNKTPTQYRDRVLR